MLRKLYPGARLIVTGAAVLWANCAVPKSASVQTTPVELPADCSAYASSALPEEAERAPVPKSFPGCASYRSYRGIGRPVNYSESRACAWQERRAEQAGLSQNSEEPPVWVGGSLILADIYFNGTGVKRNVPLAMRLACESEEGMAKLALPDIAKLDTSSSAHQLFEFCHYAATTITMSLCNKYASEIDDDRRGRYYNSLKSSMTTEQRTAFEKLLSAQSAYVRAHASEVDIGGTIRAIRTIGSEDILNELFHTEVAHFERKKWPTLSENQVATAETLLRSQYEKTLQRLQTRPKEESYDGAVTADHVSDVEKAWETYRDAWVAFARLRYPSTVAAIRAEITLRRYSFLKTIY